MMIGKAAMAISLLAVLLATPAIVRGSGMDMGTGHHMEMHDSGMMGMQGTDNRTSLGLSGPMRRTQLAMMRDHLKAVNAIVELIAARKFDEASRVAHQNLGLTPQMRKMCDMFANVQFRRMGIAFHKSADHLGDVLKTRDTKASLNALHDTMNYCIACHQSFRQ